MRDKGFCLDEYISSLYEGVRSPYQGATQENAAEITTAFRASLRDSLGIDRIPNRVDTRVVRELSSRSYRGVTVKKISVDIAVGLPMMAYLLIPDNIATDNYGIVALSGHGYGACQTAGLTKGGRKKVYATGGYQQAFGLQLALRGHVVIVPEFAGFGEAKLRADMWKPFYSNSCRRTTELLSLYGVTTAGLRIYQAMCCMDILSDLQYVDAERLGVFGISGGGLVSLYTAALDLRVRKAVVSCYVNTFHDSIMSVWHCPDNYIPNILNVGEIYDIASAVAPRELLVESGVRDRIFPISASKLAHEKIRDVYKLWGAESSFRVDVFDGGHRISGDMSYDFFSVKHSCE